MGVYTSEYSGSEIDKAVGSTLGNKYAEYAAPGCRLLGRDSANPQNLYEVIIPGKYTILHYTDFDDNGPISLSDIGSIDTVYPDGTIVKDYVSIAGNSPIFMTVSDSGSHTYQRIMIGAALFWRDLKDANDHDWKFVNMGVTQTVIVDNLTSTSSSSALSANMGRVLKGYIDNLDIGNYNLISNSGLVRDASCWNIPTYANVTISRDTSNMYRDHPTFHFAATNNASTNYISVANLGIYDTPVILNDTYTGSVYVKTSKSVEAFVQLNFINASTNAVVSSETTNMTISPGAWTRIVATKKNPSGDRLRISFGIKGAADVLFANPKIECGAYATQWMPSYFDMWREYDNANYINEVLVDTDALKDRDGLIYDANEETFINYPVATGGGGGVIRSTTEPEHSEVLWYKVANDANHFYIYNTTEKRWTRAFLPIFSQTDEPPADSERAWLDTRKASASVPATLNYYDTNTASWRPVGAAPGVNWVFSETPPDNIGLIWIQIPSFVMKLWYDGAWVPIHAIWGTDITST